MKTQHQKSGTLAVVLFLLFGLSLTDGCTQAQKQRSKTKPPAKVPSGFKTYTTKDGWSISYPKNWIARTERFNSSEPYLLEIAPDEPNSVYMNVHFLEKPRTEALQKRAETTRKAAQTREGYKELSVRELEINRVPALEYIFSFEKDGQTVNEMRVWFKKGGFSIMIFCQGPTQQFDKYSATINQIVTSVGLEE